MPFWTAAWSRPKSLLGIPLSSYMQVLDTRLAMLETRIGMRTINLAVGGAPRARARAMVRIGMVRLGMEARGGGRDTSSRAAAAAPSRRSAATGRNSCSACAASLAMRRRAAARVYITIVNDWITLTKDYATTNDSIAIPTHVWTKIPPKAGLNRLAERAEAAREAVGWQRTRWASAMVRSSLEPNSWRG